VHVIRDVGSLAASIGVREESPGEGVAEAQVFYPSRGAEGDAGGGVVAGGIVGIVGRIGTDVGSPVVEVGAVDPLPDVTPRILDVPVLNGSFAVSAGRAAGVVAHAVRSAGVDGRAIAVNVAATDLRLAVPVGKLHQVEEPARIPCGEVAQRPLAALPLGAGAELRPGLIDQWRSAG